MEQNYAVHYDFKKIDKVKTLDKYKIEISLKESDPFLIYEFDHPEFRPIHKTNLASKNANYPSITSGFYFIKSAN
jgi:MarR-like DNA-binding transcriptional regulator SgrR of sgrS sRNA